jgi:hypothetical protein
MTSCSIGIGSFHVNRWIMRLVIAVALAIMGGLAVPQAQAQVTYHYQGMNYSTFSSPYTTTESLQITLTSPAPLGVGPCPAGTVITFSDGTATFIDATSSNNHNLICGIQAIANGIPTSWVIEITTSVPAPGCVGLICLEDTKVITSNGSDSVLIGPSDASLSPYAEANAAGRWYAPSALDITAALMTQVAAMQLPSTATSLTDQLASLEIVETLPGSSLACLDLKATQANVASLYKQKTITLVQENIINPWVMSGGYIATSLGCH